jgi:hypothetical protein
MSDNTSNAQQDETPADDSTAAQTGSESPEEGQAAEEAAEDAVIDD